MTTTAENQVTSLPVVQLVESDLVFHPDGYENHLKGMGLDLPTANKYQQAEALFAKQVYAEVEAIRENYTFSSDGDLQVSQLKGSTPMGQYRTLDVLADINKTSVFINNEFTKLANNISSSESYPDAE